MNFFSKNNKNDCTKESCRVIVSIYRLYTGAALFHIVIALLLLISLKFRFLARFSNSIHNGFWLFKIPLCIFLMFCAMKIPTEYIVFNGKYLFTLSALLFVIFQSIISIELSYYACQWISDKYVDIGSTWLEIFLAAGTIGSIFLQIMASVVMAIKFYNYGCTSFEYIVNINLFICIIAIIISICKKVQESNINSGLTLSSVVTLYTFYNTTSALIFNDDMTCEAFKSSTNINLIAPVFTWILTFLYLIHTTVYSAKMSHLIHIPDGYTELSTDDYEDTPKKISAISFFFIDLDEEFDDSNYVDNHVIFSYSFFHIVFSTSIAYTAKMFTNWSSPVYDDNENDYLHNNTFLHLRIGAAWAALVMFMWNLLYPVLFQDKFF